MKYFELDREKKFSSKIKNQFKNKKIEKSEKYLLTEINSKEK